ncbi:MAG: ABC transporter substrate-binding protein [Verrucomicrobia bacterium]|jgi:iron complex transport system substrate-binding protein|nr:ABC transporter substrate-binding protein [Verrucomicrobiota bacterium]
MIEMIHSGRTWTLVLSWLAMVLPTAQGAETRLVTVGGAATEIVFALGAGDQVVAVDTSSTYPESVRQLPQVGYVRNLSPEGVLSMAPDLVIATGAVGPPAARKLLERVDVPLLWLPDPVGFADLRQSIRMVAARLERESAGDELLKTIKAQLATARERAKAFGSDRPRVLFLLEPPGPGAGGMAGGRDSRAAALVELAGGRNAVEDFSGFQPVSRESLLSINPDVIFIGRSSAHGGGAGAAKSLLEDTTLAGVAAVQRDAVFEVPLSDLAFGTRLGEAVLRWNSYLTEAIKTD